MIEVIGRSNCSAAVPTGLGPIGAQGIRTNLGLHSLSSSIHMAATLLYAGTAKGIQVVRNWGPSYCDGMFRFIGRDNQWRNETKVWAIRGSTCFM